MKKQGHKLTSFRPSSTHWTVCTKVTVNLGVFDEFLYLAAQEALWQFANMLPIMKVEASTQAAKENAVFNLIYINFLRMIFAQMIQNTDKPVISLEVLNKLAGMNDDDSMEKFVREELIPLVKSPRDIGITLPTFKGSWDAAGNLIKFLYKKVRCQSNSCALKMQKI